MLHKSLLSISLILLVLFSNAQIATGIINLPNDDAEARLKVMQQQLYELVKAQPELTNNFNLQQFIYDNQLNSLDFIHLIGKFISKGNIAYAKILLNNWSDINDDKVDDNYRQYYKWVVEMTENTTFTPNAEDVWQYANKCPIKEGVVIYAYRNLYNALTRTINKFENSCNSNTSAKSVKKSTEFIRLKSKASKKSIVAKGLTIYPNPANNVINIVEIGINKAEICDIAGRVISSINKNNITTINTATLKNGLYIIKTTTATNQVFINKLLIQH